MTGLNVQNKNLSGQVKIEHIDNNIEVREMLTKRGIFPENLTAAEDVKKLERKLKGEEKKVLKEIKKRK
jgi:DNA-damage-inducible protein D